MRTAVDLLAEMEKVLPPIPKPLGRALSFHPTDCMQCEFLRRDLENYNDPLIPDEAVFCLRNELSLLSAEGFRWALLSYLRRCLTQDSGVDEETEFLIYTLGPDPEHESETESRLSLLSPPQLQLLLSFFERCAKHPHWSEYCPDEIAKARSFVARLVAAGSAS
jgi:hypothetical protein